MPIINHQNYQLIEQYLSYLTVIKGRADKTIREYRSDLLMFFQFIHDSRNKNNNNRQCKYLCDVDAEFISSISLPEMYSFIVYCQNERQSSPATRARKIVSIRQFWKYLKTKAHLLVKEIKNARYSLLLQRKKLFLTGLKLEKL